MKKLLLTLVAFCAALAAAAQTPDTTAAEGYRFTDVKLIPMTPVKDQSRSGTCWCYSTLSFLEGEILRAGGAPVHLSEMWIVRHTFMEKAVKYIRMHGEINFAEGGASRDVTEGIRNYGIVPFEAYPGFNYGTEKADFHELSRVLKAYLDAVMEASTKSSNKPLSTAWKRGFNAILDEYFGPMPETFTYQGKEYTPRTFADSLPIDIDDYIDISSFTHHPFYTQFIIEVPDNWMWGTVYNLPLDEMMAVVDNALENGYPVAWGTDVSEKGFSRTKAIGIVPAADLEGMGGTEAERWGKLTQKEKDDALYKFDKPGKELAITQEMRQEAFDNYGTTDDHGMVIMGTATDLEGMGGTEAERWGKLTQKEKDDALYKFDKPGKELAITQEMRQEAFDNYGTTDDHGMVIMGTATDQAGNHYYKVQNSWDVRPPYDGFWYFSRPFVAYKTTSVMVNKHALPKEIARKLGIK